jgi:radical SAM protein (TIGR01212 family)
MPIAGCSAPSDYGDFLTRLFGCKVQKLSINAGFTCPNRDGSKGVGGCTYCNNASFNPAYCRPQLSVSAQIEAGKRFFARKYKHMSYLAYFQAYTNTYSSLDLLKSKFEEALSVDGVVGLIISTRPDCVPDAVLDYIAALNGRCPVMIEYGIETSHDATLAAINRCHTWADSVDAVNRTAARGITCGAHLILGLPGEDVADFVATVEAVSALPVSVVKFHQLQVLKGTRLARQVEDGEVSIMRWTAREYADVCVTLLRHLSPHIVVERFVSQSPRDMLLYPQWDLKNQEISSLIYSRL